MVGAHWRAGFFCCSLLWIKRGEVCKTAITGNKTSEPSKKKVLIIPIAKHYVWEDVFLSVGQGRKKRSRHAYKG